MRTFDGTGLKKEHLAELEKHIAEIICPFDANITFRILDANKNNLSSPVIVGADTYLAAKVELNGQYELAYGYCFEEACLYAASMGIGLAHFDLTRKENGLSGRFTFKDPGLKTPENVHYVVSFEKD